MILGACTCCPSECFSFPFSPFLQFPFIFKIGGWMHIPGTLEMMHFFFCLFNQRSSTPNTLRGPVRWAEGGPPLPSPPFPGYLPVCTGVLDLRVVFGLLIPHDLTIGRRASSEPGPSQVLFVFSKSCVRRFVARCTDRRHN